MKTETHRRQECAACNSADDCATDATPPTRRQ